MLRLLPRALLPFLSLLLVAGFWPPAVHAYVGEATLEKQIQWADVIVVAEEADVSKYEGTWVATARVKEVWKGEVGDSVRFIAEPTWACDVSTAGVGNTVVLFLHAIPLDTERFGLRLIVPRFDSGPPAMTIVHAGRARYRVVETMNGTPYAKYGDDVIMPVEIRASQYKDAYNFARLDVMRKFVQRFLWNARWVQESSDLGGVAGPGPALTSGVWRIRQ